MLRTGYVRVSPSFAGKSPGRACRNCGSRVRVPRNLNGRDQSVGAVTGGPVDPDTLRQRPFRSDPHGPLLTAVRIGPASSDATPVETVIETGAADLVREFGDGRPPP